MPNRPHIQTVNVAAGVPETGNNTETVIATITNIVPEVASQPIRLRAIGVLTLGATSTGGTFRFRRLNLTGTLVGTAKVLTNVAVAAGVADFAVEDEDNQGEGNFTYVLTYQGTGDTGVATVTGTELTASWF